MLRGCAPTARGSLLAAAMRPAQPLGVRFMSRLGKVPISIPEGVQLKLGRPARPVRRTRRHEGEAHAEGGEAEKRRT